ncbi:MAG: hypothetical protein CL840_11095 [Crocinitomicaceae bacterium]|nr:hypothetical protein [Crocinitomicaceae bacterium]|tara:strand:+ start:2868 stop:3509 length:642 start_codon:yes stop_codon:yes gene_type:complete
MPVHYIKEINAGLRIGLWKIEESTKNLYDRTILNHEERSKFTGFTNDRRKREWLATRCLLQQMLPEVTIQYCENGKPSLNKAGPYISLSHTRGWVLVVLSDKNGVGCDIEIMSPKVLRIKDKFASDQEQHLAENHNSKLAYYTLIWSAKEAIYKQKFHEEFLEFKTQISIIPENELDKEGMLTAEVSMLKGKKSIKLNYLVADEYVLVYTLND